MSSLQQSDSVKHIYMCKYIVRVYTHTHTHTHTHIFFLFNLIFFDYTVACEISSIIRI